MKLRRTRHPLCRAALLAQATLFGVGLARAQAPEVEDRPPDTGVDVSAGDEQRGEDGTTTGAGEPSEAKPPTPPSENISALEAGAGQPSAEKAPVVTSQATAEAGSVSGAEASDVDATGDDPEAMLAELDSALGQDELTGTTPNLSLYGFSDFSFYKYFLEDNAIVNGILYDQSAFAVGNLNVYLAGDLTEGWESLAEIRFTYLPNGSRRIDASGVERTDTVVADYTNFGRERRLGGIFIERVWLQYTPDPLFSIRGGTWLTPYGIWNVDHGSPTIIPVLRPYVIGLELLPERQTGLLVRGTGYPTEDLSLGYAVGLSNGRGPVQDYADLDENKAVTLRFNSVLRTRGALELGASGYYGRYTNSEQSLRANGIGFQIVDELVEQYDELALGVDLKYTVDGFHGQAEFIHGQRRYTDEGRLQRTSTTYYPDDRRFGGYGVLGYRFQWFGLMPYVTGEYFRFLNNLEPNLPATQVAAVVGAVGLNCRPTPNVTLKLEGTYGTFFGDIPEASTFGQPVWALQSQAAWAF